MQNKQKSDIHDKIVEKALELFREKGVRAVRMDDISKDLKMSKRTIYEMFSDKEQILLECLRLNTARSRETYLKKLNDSNNIMEVLCFFVRHSLSKFSDVNPLFFVEAVRYQSVREYLEKVRAEENEAKREFLNRGIEEGLLVADINYEVLDLINRAAINNIISEKVYEKVSVSELFYTFIMVFLRGMLTEKGMKELNKLLNENA